MPQFINAMGIVGNQFKIGMGEKAPSIFATPDGQLYFNAPIQIKGRVEGMPYVPAAPEDLATLDVVEKLNSKTYTDACNFAKNLVLQAGVGGGEGGEGGDTPPTLVIENTMPDPVMLETMSNGTSLSLGVVERDKYIHQIAMELEQIFSSSDGARYEAAIGNDTTQNAYVDWFELTAMKSSAIFDVVKTIPTDTEVKLFIRDWIDPNPWVQRVLNPHETATIAIKSNDAKKRIYEVTITCNNIYPGDDVVHTDIFGEDVLGKGYLDFGIPIKLKKNGRYRITQIDNPALEQFNGKDPDVDVNDGVWSKSSTMGPFGTGFNEEEGAQYFFLLGQSRGDNDYTHIYVYDLDATDNTAIWVFHVKNEIMTITPEEPDPIPPEDAAFVFDSASEGTMTTSKQEDGTYIVNLSGEVTDRSEELESSLSGISSLSGKFTTVQITLSGYSGRSFRFICQNPAYEYFYGTDEQVQFNDGVYYVDVAMEVPESGSFTMEILISDKPGDINIIVLGDSAAEQADLVTIVNNLAFVDETTPVIPEAPAPETPETPDPAPEESETSGEEVTEEEATDDGIAVASELDSIGAEADDNDRNNSDQSTVKDDPLPTVKTGRARIRMIVF